jgi:hypothetical protein
VLRVERQGPLVRLAYSGGGREAVAVGPAGDLPSLLGVFVAQMVREGFSAEEMCRALREALEALRGRPNL